MADPKVVEVDEDGNVVDYADMGGKRKEEKIRKRKNLKGDKGKGKARSDDELEEKSDNRGLNMFFLFLFIGIPIMTGLVTGWDWFINSKYALKMGLVSTPRERIVAYYKKWNPEKLGIKGFVDKTERKWRGKYDKLFKVLDKKYKHAKDEDEY